MPSIKSSKKMGILLLMGAILISSIAFSQIGIISNDSDENNLSNISFDENNTEIVSDKYDSPNFIEESLIPSSAGASSWWDEDFEYRIEISITEPNSRARTNTPVEVFLTFENETCFVNSTRIILYSAGTESQTEIPSQLWNETYWKNGTGLGDYSDFIASCTISFSVSINLNAVNTYYVYYSSAIMENNADDYYLQTKMSTTYENGRVKVDTNDLYIELGNGTGVDVLKFSDAIASGTNYHSDTSMSPLSTLIAGGDSETFSPNSLGYILNWLVVGSFSCGNVYNSFPTGEDLYHVDYSKYYVEGDYATPQDPAISGSDGTKQWATYQCASNYIDFNSLYSPNDYVAAYAMCYVYFPQDEPSVYMKVSSDDGVGVKYDLGVQSEYNHALRGLGTDSDVWQISGGVSAGWHSFMFMVEENTGSFSLRFRLSTTGGSGDSNYTPISGLTVALVPKVNIESVSVVEEGPVFTKLAVQWEDSSSMKTWDIITLFNNYEMYKYERTFWWKDDINEVTGNNWTICNTNYPSSSITGMDDWVTDGISRTLSSDGFNSIDYTFTYDSGGNSYFTGQGLFLTDFYAGNEIVSLSSVNMTGVYSSNQPMIIPGYQTDLDNFGPRGSDYPTDSDYNITIEFWEMTQKYMGIGVETITQQLNGYSNALQNPLTYASGSPEPLFFNLGVQLYDADNLGASNVNVTLFNSTDNWSGVNYAQGPISNLKSDASGFIDFSNLKGANYTCLVSYQAYNNPVVNLTWFNVTVNTTKSVTVSNLNLTRITINLVQYDSTEPVIGANVSLYWNNTAPEWSDYAGYVGFETSDSSGGVSFYYLNSSYNYSVKVLFYNNFRKINATTELLSEIDYTVNFTVANSVSKTIWVQLEAFSSSLSRTSEDLFNTKFWGDELLTSVKFESQYGEETDNILGATVSYELSLVGSINKITGSFDEDGAGVYSLSFASDDPSFNLDTLQLYIMTITAQRSGFNPYTITNQIYLKEITTDISTSVSSVDQYWNENFTVDVFFEDIYNDLALGSASVSYDVAQLGSVYGSLESNGTAGWYSLTLNTTDFIYSGLYTLTFTAEKNHYVSQSISVSVNINKIRTYLNDKIFVPQSLSVNVTTQYIFEFVYTDSVNKGIENATVANYEWESEGLGLSGNGTLIEKGNGVYWLDFRTDLRPIGEYSLVVSIGQTNYVERTSVIALNIVEKPIQVVLLKDAISGIIEKPQGVDIQVTLQLVDLVASHATGSIQTLTGADVSITYEGNTYALTEEANGTYSLIISTQEYQALAAAINFQATLSISKANYSVAPINIAISIAPPEFVIGSVAIPKIFVFIGLGVGFVAIVVYGTSRYVKYARIPTIIKKIMETKKVIKKGGKMTDAKVVRSIEDIFRDENEADWKALGLNLQKKKIPSDAEHLSPADEAAGGI